MIHGGIDGYSRMIVFLACSTDNKAGTVFNKFIHGVEEFGLPSRIRSDKGGENVDVAWYYSPIQTEAQTEAVTSLGEVYITSELRDCGETCLLVAHTSSITCSISWRNVVY